MTDLDPEPSHTPNAAAGIRAVVEAWVVYRDAGFWERFESLWHKDGWMSATWFQGPYADYVRVSREGFEAGVRIAHFLGGFTCDVKGDRAIAQTKMNIEYRALLDGVEVDVTCSGRFYDFMCLSGGRWTIVRRQPIYERDRIDAVIPTATVVLDDELLSSFPIGYRHLGYVQEQAGYSVMRGLPGVTGPEVELLYREGEAWLAGSAKPGSPLQKRE